MRVSPQTGILLALMLSACPVPFEQAVDCLGDLDCPAGAACVDGKCVARPTVDAGATDAHAPDAGAPDAGPECLIAGCPAGEGCGASGCEPADRLLVLAGELQDVHRGELVPIAPQVQAVTASGAPVPGATVEWTVVTGGGSVQPASTTTDADGLASTAFTLGQLVGEQTIRATGTTAAGYFATTLISVTAHGARPVYRSVGFATIGALASGGSGNPMTLSGGTATFGAPLSNRVGVGDAVQFVADGSGDVDSIAFVTRRNSSVSYELRDVDGEVPATVATASPHWAIYRAYTSLQDALVGNENAAIHPAVRNFDEWVDGCDTVVGDMQWNLACYDDAVDSTPATASWWTGPQNWLRIYTPTAADEVGVSQRHAGKPGSGYRRTASLTLSSLQSYVRIEGLSITVADSWAYGMAGTVEAGEVHFDACFGRATGAANFYGVFDLFNTGRAVVKVSNCVALNESLDTEGRGFSLPGTNLYYLSNTTAVGVGGAAFWAQGGQCHARNLLGASAQRLSFESGDAWTSVESCASDDASAAAFGGSNHRLNQTFTFVDRDAGDLHLSASDTGARGGGLNLTDDVNLPIAADIDGDPRPAPPAAWDIGADQLP